MIWILSFSSSLGYIYLYKPKENELTLLETLENPKGTLKNQDIMADRPGHYDTFHSARSAYEYPTDAHTAELERFIKTIADYLKISLDNEHYQQLILCANPHVTGMLLEQLDKQVKKHILSSIKKNFIESDSNELPKQNVKENTKILAEFIKQNWWDISRGQDIS